MRKNIFKILTISFIAFYFVIGSFIGIVYGADISTGSSTGDTTATTHFLPQSILNSVGDTSAGTGNFASMVNQIYKYAVGIVALFAFGAIVYGGILYTVSVGNPAKSREAWAWIRDALLGLLLLFAAYAILYFINPNLVNLTNPQINDVKVEAPQVQTSGTPSWLIGTYPVTPGGVIAGGETKPSRSIYDDGTSGKGVCVAGSSRSCNEMSADAAQNYQNMKVAFEQSCRASGYTCSLDLTSTLTGSHESSCHQFGNSKTGTCGDMVITGCGSDSKCLNTALLIFTNDSAMKQYYTSCLNEYTTKTQYTTGDNIHCNF